MGKRLLKRILMRGKTSAATVSAVFSKPRRITQGQHLGFIKKQLSFQSKYFPQLTAIHNRLILKAELYPKSKVPVITGSRSVDIALARNMKEMHRLEFQINDLRQAATKISDPAKSLEQARKLVKSARKLERRFNNLKEKNFQLFLKHFAAEQKPAQYPLFNVFNCFLGLLQSGLYLMFLIVFLEQLIHAKANSPGDFHCSCFAKRLHTASW